MAVRLGVDRADAADHRVFLAHDTPHAHRDRELPARAAKGEVAHFEVMGMVGKRIGNELLATLCVAGLAVLVA